MPARLRLLVVLLLLVILGPPAAAVVIDNPYQDLDWATIGRHKANLHTHTTESDGALTPAEAIDAYHAKGYTVLAITDHNRNTWPWTAWHRDPTRLGMLAISGNEYSRGHHRGAFFCTIDGDPGGDEDATVAQAIAAGGLAMLYHPGRYNQEVGWYVALFRKHPGLFGLEVFNQGDRYPQDRGTWDQILGELMPARPVWGYSNDDMHLRQHLYHNYSFFLLPELTEAALCHALRSGHSYFVHEPSGSGEAQAPRIEAIAVADGVITIRASGHQTISWWAGGRAVAAGEHFDVATQLAAGTVSTYVRAEIVGPHGVTCTQPFGLRPEPEPKPEGQVPGPTDP